MPKEAPCEPKTDAPDNGLAPEVDQSSGLKMKAQAFDPSVLTYDPEDPEYDEEVRKRAEKARKEADKG